MYTSVFLIATALSYVAATPAPQSSTFVPIFLGSACSTTSQCPGGSQCYAVNSMLQPTCGGFQASCTTDAQCATNSCLNSFCSGPVVPTLPLGTPCYESAQCVNGAGCYAGTSMQVPVCGNYGASCVASYQCLVNTCVSGFCTGLISSASPATTPVSTPSSSMTSVPATGPTLSTTSTAMTTRTVPASGTGSRTTTVARNSTIPTATRSPTPVFTGGASEKLRAGLGGALIASAVGFALMIVV